MAPNIPEDKLGNALKDYARTVSGEDVLALFDATLMGSAKDGAVFTRDRFVFQNNDLEPIHNVRYEDIVQVDSRRKLLGGRRVLLTVNRGQATFEIELDFSGKPKAADFVQRFLREAMLHPGNVATDSAREASSSEKPAETGHIDVRQGAKGTATDKEAVMRTLKDLRDEGLLSTADYSAMIRVLER